MYHKLFLQASVVELVDTPDLGSGAAMRGGSSPFTRTIFNFPPSPISSKSFLKFLINTGFSSFLVLF